MYMLNERYYSATHARGHPACLTPTFSLKLYGMNAGGMHALTLLYIAATIRSVNSFIDFTFTACMRSFFKRRERSTYSSAPLKSTKAHIQRLVFTGVENIDERTITLSRVPWPGLKPICSGERSRHILSQSLFNKLHASEVSHTH